MHHHVMYVPRSYLVGRRTKAVEPHVVMMLLSHNVEGLGFLQSALPHAHAFSPPGQQLTS
jgi:hypothetical protein